MNLTLKAIVVKHQTELDPFAAFIKNSQTGRVNTSKQGNGESESTIRVGAGREQSEMG